MTPAKVLTALGLGSVAIGFAFKDISENFLAGVLILLREPFKFGDYVESGDIDGQVEEITIRDIHIRQTDGQLVVMPNALLVKQPVTVRTDKEFCRTTGICGIAYHEDVDQACDVIATAVKKIDSVRRDIRDVQIFAREFSSSSVDFEVRGGPDRAQPISGHPAIKWWRRSREH